MRIINRKRRLKKIRDLMTTFKFQALIHYLV
jgi:hypothetical protein